MRIAFPPPLWLRALCLAAFLAAILQIFFFAQPAAADQLRSLAWDKLLHAIAYGVLGLLLWVVVGFNAPLANWLAVTGVGALDEVHQLFVPLRTPDVHDVVADAVGAAVVTFALHRWRSRCAES